MKRQILVVGLTIIAAMFLAIEALGKTTVTFRFFPDNHWIQPVVGMKLHITYDSGVRTAQPDFARCEVFNVKDDPQVHLRCNDTVYKIDGMSFEGEHW